MKTTLRFLLFTVLSALSFNKINGQCTVSNIIIQNVSVAGVQAAGTCTVTFDASFTIQNNNGNKFIFLHAWLQSAYPDYFHCINGTTSLNGSVKAPDASVLANAFLNIGIDNNDTVPSILTEYTPDPTVPLTTIVSIQKEVLPDGSAVIILKGITTTVPVTCGTPVVIIADLWSSQAASAKVAHCVSCGLMSAAGFVTAVGLVNCTTLTYNASLTNNTATAVNGYYRLYADINRDGYFTPAIDTLIKDTTNFSVPAGIGSVLLVSGSVPGANLNQNIFMVLTYTDGDGTGASRVVVIRSTQCAALPVTFRSFNANRTNRSNVLLKWETATEENNKGFELQRSSDNSHWETISFINSQAVSGNSNELLTYIYNDVNTNNGMTQYRIKQVDFGNKGKYSEIRSVRGDGQKGKTIVYPNPSFDGRVNIVFEDVEGTRQVMLMDINGRVLRQWKNVTGNTITAENLEPGMYTMRIVVQETGEQSIEKIIVSRR